MLLSLFYSNTFLSKTKTEGDVTTLRELPAGCQCIAYYSDYTHTSTKKFEAAERWFCTADRSRFYLQLIRCNRTSTQQFNRQATAPPAVICRSCNDIKANAVTFSHVFPPLYFHMCVFLFSIFSYNKSNNRAVETVVRSTNSLTSVSAGRVFCLHPSLCADAPACPEAYR